MTKTQRTADCVRRVGNWSKVEPRHRFDKRTFQKEQMDNDIPLASPKLDVLLEKIEELDKRDMEKHGHLFKHMIFSDVKSLGYGAKIVASAFLARGYHPAYGNDLQVKEATLARTPSRNFALLCSTPVYGKAIPSKLKASVLQAYNQRPDNIHGRNIRFLILDQGYKEGIDVMDIKYVHLVEPAITMGDEKQAIGRGTRLCGQQGLKFHLEKGWPLYVFRYNSLLPGDPAFHGKPTLHDLFLEFSGLDLRQIQMANDLERMCILGAVDHDLTENIHTFRISGKITCPALPKAVEKELNRLSEDPKTSDTIVLYGKQYKVGEPIHCKSGCKGIIPVPTPLMLIAWIVHSADMFPFKIQRPRSFLCKDIMENKAYCKILNQAWQNPELFMKKYKNRIRRTIEQLQKEEHIHMNSLSDVIEFLPSEVPPLPTHTFPSKKIPFMKMRRHILQEFGDYKWGNVTVENGCMPKTPESQELPKGGSAEVPAPTLVEFTPSQRFLQDYFQPSNPYKGMLLFQSVGSGKSCTAIATASHRFEKEGYTILWVTRHTLKSEIWKNMFGQVCHLQLRDRIQAGEVLPKTLSERKKLLPDNWIQPISYKQFSNFLKGRNKILEKAIVSRNGKEDPLRKTLVIIDEVHKLYAPDVVGSEKPDVGILRDMIQHSYKKSGKDSVRLLLMSATPYTSDPMDLIRILNFLREENEQLPEVFSHFSQTYLDASGRFTDEGMVRFLQEITGYISYLNRENDLRQFAYPILTEVTVPISRTISTAREEGDVRNHERELERYQDLVREEIPETIRTIREVYKEKKEDCKDLPTKKERDECKDRVTRKYKELRGDLDNKLDHAKEGKTREKANLRDAKKRLEKRKKEDISQETVLKRDCLPS